MISLPQYAKPLFDPYRYKVVKGGRGSAKSYSVAKILLLKGAAKKCFVLCAREFQNSMADSVHKLLEEQITVLGLQDFYKVKKHEIVGKNGTKFIFKGLWQNTNSIKSIPGITDLWLEEAQTVSQESWDILTPTIREEESEIWVTYNPVNDDDPTHVMFTGEKCLSGDYLIIEANWRDNPWFPNVLRKEMEHMKRTNPQLALHVWEGECRSNSDAQIFKDKYVVKDFEVSPDWVGPLLGADWGFSIDPTVLVKLYVDATENKLYWAEDAGGVGIEMDDIPKEFKKVSESNLFIMRGDCSRPETISYVARKGFPLLESCAKWEGCVEDGIDFIKSFDEVVIHPSCTESLGEFKKYSFKVDKLTGKVTRKIVDKHNHYMDAGRYALEPLIQAGRQGLLSVL